MIWLGIGIGFVVGAVAGFFLCYGVVVHLCKLAEEEKDRKDV